MKVHMLKSWPEFFAAVRSSVQRFEIRRNDRGFAAGDMLVLQEFDPHLGGLGQYTGRATYAIVDCVVNSEGLIEGYVALGIRQISYQAAMDLIEGKASPRPPFKPEEAGHG